MADHHNSVSWWKSTRSNDSYECVEVADLAVGVRGIRDSKDPGGTVLAVPAGQFAALLDGIKAGQLG